MNVLIIGSGGREHALTWKIRQSVLCRDLFVWPGHPGSLRIAQKFCDDRKASFEDLAIIAKEKEIDYIICGPEVPLAEGFADFFKSKGFPVFGPVKESAQLESSKAFSKEFMKSAGIPTADFEVIGLKELSKVACEKLKQWNGVVIKASGLASGKGVFVCHEQKDIDEALLRLNSDAMKKAAETIVLEKLMVGKESSYFVFLKENGFHVLGSAVDHKRLLNGDKGPNTGGMGCYSPVPWVTDENLIHEKVLNPFLAELKRRGMSYVGCLYIGLMWTNEGPKVVEFNVRLGDPEAQVLAVSDSSDWLAVMTSGSDVKSSRKAALCYVLASEGYPYGEKKEVSVNLGEEIFSEQKNSIVFGASLAQEADVIKTGSGRVLNVVGFGDDFETARSAALKRIEEIKKVWPTFQWRSDIGGSLFS